MKILWLCNFMLPAIAVQLHREATNKEGWISGLAQVVLGRQHENDITLAVAFPVNEAGSGRSCLLEDKDQIISGTVKLEQSSLRFYGFYEDTSRPECYDAGLERRLSQITGDFKPDIVHCFGTEYPHTLALCRSFPQKDRILVGIQGLCSVYANAYFANLPEQVIHSVTLRDFLKKDSLARQQEKFAARGAMEIEAVRLAGNVTGRTAWDRFYTEQWNPGAEYHMMNETLRADFYHGAWKEENCIPRSIFLSQGDYPIKGLHYMLAALPAIREKYPDVQVFVAGNSLVKYGTWKEKLKISAYGRYLRRLIRKNGLEKNIQFLGKLNAQAMKDRYLKSNLFVCCSAIENSPNSLGEAMLLGMPCVSADVGGIPSIFDNGKDGILYGGFKTAKNEFDNMCNEIENNEKGLDIISKRLADAVVEIWSDKEKMLDYCKNARNHAQKTHNGEANYRKMTEIYSKILQKTTEPEEGNRCGTE